MNAVTISSSAVVFALTTLVAADSGVDGGGGAPTAVGTGFVIPDLTLGVTTSIVLSGDSFPGIVNPGMIVGLTINPEHTWVGDLIFSLSHNDGHDTVSADLFRRMGMTTAGSGFGNSNDLQGLYRFSDSFAIPFWSAPNITGNIVPGDYRPTTNLFNAAPGPVVSLGAVFANRTIAGTWTLTISDHGSGDFGTLESWALWLDVPVPGAWTLLAIAGLTPSRRRRL